MTYESSLNGFGRWIWITTHSWQDVSKANGIMEKADVFYNTVMPEIDKHFPEDIKNLSFE